MYRDKLLFPIAATRSDTMVWAIGWDSRPNATRAPVKRRDCAVIHYVLRGSGWFDGIKIGPGQGFYFAPGEAHDYFASEEDPWEYIFMDLEPQFALRVAVPAIHADERGVFSFSFVGWLLQWAERSFGTARITFISETESVYRASSILRRHQGEKNESTEKQLLYVQKAQGFIEKNMNNPLTAADVANVLNLNQSYLRKLFVRYTGAGIKEYITEQKLGLAQELLTETELSVKEVAWKLGIRDSNSFSKLFRAKTGFSPTEFRALHKAE